MIRQSISDAWSGFMSRNAQISPAVTSPESSMVFDQLQLPDIRTAPHRPIAPFGARERTVGAPQALFAANTVRRKIRRGRTAPIGDWLNIIDHLSGYGAKGQIAGINLYLNKSRNIKDIAAYGKKKAWTRPIDYFDCADKSVDYAFAKYVSLRLLGFHASRLRLVWLVDEIGNHHAVMSLLLRMQTFILDTRSNDIRTDDAFTDSVPFFSLNGACFYIHWTPNSSDSADAALSRIEQRLCKNQMLRH